MNSYKLDDHETRGSNILPDETLMAQSLHALYEEISRLRGVIQQQDEQLKSMALELLLRGHWKPMEHISELLRFQYDYHVVGNYDFVNTISTGTTENPEMAQLKQQIFRVCSQCFAPQYPCFYCETEIGLNTILLNVPNLAQNSDPTEENAFLSCAGSFIQRVEEELHVQLKLCLSFCCHALTQLPDALKEVERLRQLQETVPNAARILYAGRLELESEPIDLLPAQLEQSLFQYIRGRNIPAAHRRFNQLVMQELREFHDMEKLIGQLGKRLDQIQKLLAFSDRRMDIFLETQESLKHTHKLDELLITVNRFFSHIDLQLQSEDAQPHLPPQEAGTAIRDFIDAHYLEHDLGLPRLAEQLHITENKISRTFKKAFGIGVLSYIQKLRVQQAMQLLTNSSISFSDVSRKAGFSSRRTFDRVFKQFSGMTAAQYRRTHMT